MLYLYLALSTFAINILAVFQIYIIKGNRVWLVAINSAMLNLAYLLSIKISVSGGYLAGAFYIAGGVAGCILSMKISQALSAKTNKKDRQTQTINDIKKPNKTIIQNDHKDSYLSTDTW